MREMPLHRHIDAFVSCRLACFEANLTSLGLYGDSGPAQQRHPTTLQQVFCLWLFPNQKFPPSFHVAFSLVCIQKTGAQLLKWTPDAPGFFFFFSVTCHVRVGMRRWCSWSWGDFNAWECVQKQELLPWRMLVQRDIDPVPVFITAVEVVLIEFQPCLWNIKSKWKGL